MVNQRDNACCGFEFGCGSHTRLVRLTFLAPDITRAILLGRQPATLTAAKLKEASRQPLDWRDQREVLGFG